MATAFASQKPPLGKKLPMAPLRRQNRRLSPRTHRENCRYRLRRASSAPVFANGAVSAAMAFAFNQAMTDKQQEERGSVTYGRRYSEEVVSGEHPRLVYSEPQDHDWVTVVHGDAFDVLTIWRKSVPFLKNLQVIPTLQRAPVTGWYEYKHEIVYEELQVINRGGQMEYYHVGDGVQRTGEFIWRRTDFDTRTFRENRYRTCWTSGMCD